jgi:hypothetical protein
VEDTEGPDLQWLPKSLHTRFKAAVTLADLGTRFARIGVELTGGAEASLHLTELLKCGSLPVLAKFFLPPEPFVHHPYPVICFLYHHVFEEFYILGSLTSHGNASFTYQRR